MGRGRRPWMTSSEKNELWRRWLQGESATEIARGLDRDRGSIKEVVTADGGIAPRPRRRSRLALTTSDREKISRHVAQGRSLRAIGRAVGRAPSTISREVGRNRPAPRVGQRRGQIVDAVSISERPAAVADRAIPGHWEGDLLTGAGPSYVATLVERQSRYVMLVRLPNKETLTVVRALARRVRRLPQGLMKSLTWDRGTEFAAHRTFTLATNIAVYFCDPQSPWQRGSNENTNGLLRQYLKHCTNRSVHTQAQLDAIAHRLNTRPRLTLGFQTPAAKLAAIVASTG